jgi:hypothetical protein
MAAESRVALLVFAGTFAVFIAFNAPQNLDSRYALLVSERLMTEGTFHVGGVPGLTAHDSATADDEAAARIHQNFIRVNGKVFYYFPPGTSILAAPIVGASRAFGFGVTDDYGRYLHKREGVLHSVIASLLMASLAAIFFLTAKLRLAQTPSVWIAIGAAFGSQVWSTASRSLWSHSFEIFLMGCVIWMLVRDADRKRTTNPIAMATLLSWAFFCRPIVAIPIVGIVLTLLVTRQIRLRFAVAGAVWLAGFIAFSLFHYANWLPPYYMPGRLGSSSFLEALLGNLVSPSRGLLIYVPIVLIPLSVTVLFWRFIKYRELACLALAVIVLHLLAIASFSHWWGGYSYGPRLSTDLVPWFVLLAIVGFDGASRATESTGFSRPQRRVAGALLVISILMNGQAGVARSPMKWNRHPVVAGRSIEDRLWDWRHPQFLHGIQSREHGFREELFD